MTIMLVSLVLCAAVMAFTAGPLFRQRANQPLGMGREDDSPIRRWQEEKDRLTAQLRDNDMALAEGRIDATVHSAIASRLAADADHALSRLRQAREGLTPVIADAVRRISRPSAIAGIVLVIGASFGVHAFASLSDIDRTRSPHANGQVPVNMGETAAAPQASAGMPVGADGVPDIGAMVSRLEARVAAGDYTPDDAAMLLRSYNALGREADAKALLSKTMASFPGDIRLQLTFVEAALQGTDPVDLDKAQIIVADLLKAQPDLPEARWYHSLFLVRQGDIDAAGKELHALQPLVEGIPEAALAVSSLLKRLEIPEHDQLPPR